MLISPGWLLCVGFSASRAGNYKSTRRVSWRGGPLGGHTPTSPSHSGRAPPPAWLPFSAPGTALLQSRERAERRRAAVAQLLKPASRAALPGQWHKCCHRRMRLGQVAVCAPASRLPLVAAECLLSGVVDALTDPASRLLLWFPKGLPSLKETHRTLESQLLSSQSCFSL